MSETNIESVSFFSLSNTLRTFLEIMIVDLKKKSKTAIIYLHLHWAYILVRNTDQQALAKKQDGCSDKRVQGVMVNEYQEHAMYLYS